MVKYGRQPYIIGDDAFVPLTMGKVAIINASDIDIVNGYTWTCAKRACGLFYAYRQEPIGAGKVKSVLMHREIMGASPGEIVDHKDTNGLNNRRSNLRICTHSQNMMNRKTPKHNSSGYKGVKLTKSGRWEAGISSGGKYYYLGLSDSPEEAHRKYVEASEKLHVDFGRLS